MEYPEELLHYSDTVRSQLKDALHEVMSIPEFDCFRLVGGTNLALKEDHRISRDIDLFTDITYGKVDFKKLYEILKERFKYVSPLPESTTGFGVVFYVGESEENCVKIDVMYTEPFLDDADQYGTVRMATERDMIAMKMDAIFTGARKKDFWDIHLLLEKHSLEEMIDIHAQARPYTHKRDELIKKLTDFKPVEDEPDPICLREKNWEDIKIDIALKVNDL